MSNPKNINFVKNLVASYPDKDLFTFAEVKALPGQGISVPGAFWSAIVEGTKPRLWSVSKFCADNGIVLEHPVPSNPVPVKEEEKMDLVIETRTNVDEPVNIDAREYIPSVDPDFVPTGDNYEIISRIIDSKEFFPCYIYGISGVGKTASIEHICATNNRPFFRVQITQETMDEDLIGSMKLVNGNTVWQDGPVIKAYRTGGIVVLDECDLNSSLMILQPILEKKPFYIKQTGELVSPKDGFNVFATGNTKGDGTDARYIGTTVLNEAFLERFAITLEQGCLPIEEEKKIALAEQRQKEKGNDITVAHYDMRFLKPIDEELLHEVGTRFRKIITLEDGVVRGGLGSAVLEYMADHGFTPVVKRLGLPDTFVEHGTIPELQHIVGIDSDAIQSQLNDFLTT